MEVVRLHDAYKTPTTVHMTAVNNLHERMAPVEAAAVTSDNLSFVVVEVGVVD